MIKPPPPPRQESLRGVTAALAVAVAAATPTVLADTVFTVSAQQGAAGLEAALAEARRARHGAAALTAPIRVVLEPGEYTLVAPLRLGPDDAGTATAPLVIEARVPGSVLISGAPPLRASQLDRDPWLFAPPQPLDREAERSGGQFYVNNRRATLARTPNAGAMWLLASGDGDTLTAEPADSPRIAADLAGQTDRAIVHLMQSWTSGRHAVASFDAETRRLRLSPKPRWAFLKYGPKQRYYLENVPAALDEPGEWLAAEGALHYKPSPAERNAAKGQPPSAYWPRLPQLLLIQGTPEQPVRHVKFRGLRFAYTGIPQPATGWTDNQAATGIPAAIEVNYAANLEFTRNAWQHLGGYALWLRQGVNDSQVSHNLMEDLGAGGIRVGIETSPGPRDRTGNITVQNNVLRDTGLEFPGAVALWIGRSFGNLVTANIIARTSFTAISVGWSWGFEPPSSGDNIVADNLLFDIGQHQMSDLGAIYTLGRSPGTVIRGNYVRNVEDFVGYGAGAFGLYNDEGSSDLLVEKNVVVGTHSGGYQLHYGRDITVRNNLFSAGRTVEVRWGNVKKSGPWRFEENGIGTDPEAGKKLAAPIAGATGVANALTGAAAKRRVFEWYGVDESHRMDMPSFALGAGAVDVPLTVGAGIFDVDIKDFANTTQRNTWISTIQRAKTLHDAAWPSASGFPWKR